MTSKLSDVDADDLRAALAEATDPKAVKRLVVALAYVDGVPVPTIASRYGVPRSTIYAWLDRFEDADAVAAAATDRARPGRPRKLSAAQRESLATDLADPPRARGYDADDWSVDLVCRHLAETYDVSYSAGHVRRLLDELDAE